MKDEITLVVSFLFAYFFLNYYCVHISLGDLLVLIFFPFILCFVTSFFFFLVVSLFFFFLGGGGKEKYKG